MLRRGSDPTVKLFGRPDGDTDVPFDREPTPVAAEGAPASLGGWAAPASYLGLDARLVGELTKAALGSTTVASLREAEVAVGAMLASLAIRGEDRLLEELLPAVPELRLHRYAVGQLAPIAVHAVPGVGPLLRSLASCAAGTPGETWEAVTNDGRGEPIAIAAARNHELRWLQPPAPDSPSPAPWSDVTTPDPAPGSSVAEWTQRLTASPGPALPPPALPPLAAPVDAPPPPRRSSPAPPPLLNAPGDPRSVGGPVPAFSPPVTAPPPAAATGAAGTDAIVRAVTAAVEDLLANAPLELELDAATLDELRDTTVLERLVDAITRLQDRVAQVDALSRQVTALTGAVDDLADSTRSLLRHQWDNQPPQGFWVRVQKAEDEVRRSVDELTAEVRSRLRPPR